ncbi:MAG: ATP-binding cassette domain-containing protein [Dehalococcoidia bacterium]|nr:ATP-binding cassette domain-containing protein [Dehalococcoidia bacterium]
MNSDLAIETQGLTKRFGGHVAVDGLSITVPRGAVAGFVGPNGAGKTTTMGMLLGLVGRSSGSGHVLGESLSDPSRYLGRVGASVEHPAFYAGLSGRENLRLLATVGGHDAAQVPALLDLVGLGDRGEDRFGRYSMGMKQRLAVAAALLGDPELLILDEPTNGLDPVAIHEMRRLIGTLAEDGRTIFVSSHQLSELEQTCDWLVVIDHGALLFEGPTTEFGAREVSITLVPQHLEDLGRLERVVCTDGRHAVERDDCRVKVTCAEEQFRVIAAEANRAAADEGIVLVELRSDRMSLEERYLEMVNGAAR